MQHSPPFWPAEALAAFLREQAAWRQAQAARFPRDRSNLRSANALDQLAVYVEALPESDLALRELVDAGAFDDERRFIVTDDARRLTAKYGYDYSATTTPRTLLRELVAITQRARQTTAQKRTTPMAMTMTRASESEARDHMLSANDRSTLSDIFAIAESCSSRVSRLVSEYSSALRSGDNLASDRLNDLTTARQELHAAIAPAALARVRAFGGIDLDGKLVALRGEELDGFVRPIFEEAGISDDFLAGNDSPMEILQLALEAARLSDPAVSSQAFRRLAALGFTKYERAQDLGAREAAGRPARSLRELEPLFRSISLETLDRARNSGDGQLIKMAEEEAQRRGLFHDGQRYVVEIDSHAPRR